MADSIAPRAYSYVRFSTPEQAEGDSLRRRTAAAAEWCQRNNVTLDTSATLHALGESAFTGKHRKDPERNALAGFLKLVEAGRIPKGSYLIVENMDRLSRELPVHATHLLTGILVKGVRVVQLKPNELILTDRSNLFELLQGQLTQARGQDESATKSDRVNAAWQAKKAAVRAKLPQPPRHKDGRVTLAFSGRLPAWVRDEGGKLVVIPERAAVVRQIFAWSAQGYGQVAIVKKLEDEKVPPFFPVVRRRDKDDPAKFHTKPGRWTKGYVKILLNDRRTLGEFQLRTKDGKKEGPPVAGYFPAVLKEGQFLEARAGCASRDRGGDKRRRQGKHLDLFKGLLRSAHDGSTLLAITRTENGAKRGAKLAAQRKGPKRDLPVHRSAGVRHTRHLVSLASTQGQAPYVSFPLPPLETALLHELDEIDPVEILNGDQAPKETVALANELTGLETRIAAIQEELLTGDVPAAMAALRQLEVKRGDLAGRLAEAKLREAHPLADSWGEFLALLKDHDKSAEARVRLRPVLRRIIEDIHCLFVPHGRDRLAVVQIYFRTEHAGKRRTYLVYHRPPRSNGRVLKPGGVFVHSVVEDEKDAMGLQGLDLRDRKEAAKAVKTIAKWPDATWEEFATAALLP
jgi:DNA invertase Pin-like site-specific DNA recombinase